MSVREPEDFVARVQATLDDLYQGQPPELPPWLPEDIFDDMPPASADWLRMVAAGLYARDVAWPLQHFGFAVTVLWIGLETTVEAKVEESGEKLIGTNNEKQIDFALEYLLGTSGRGWLAKRMISLGMSRSGEVKDYSELTSVRLGLSSLAGALHGPLEVEDVHYELQGICVELIQKLVKKNPTVDDATKACAYFRNAFRNKLEDRLDALIGKRTDAFWGSRSNDVLDHEVTGSLRVGLAADVLAPGESGLTPEDRVLLQRVLDGGDKLSPQERKVFLLKYRDELKGKPLAAALGTTPSTARVHLRNALKKLRPPA